MSTVSSAVPAQTAPLTGFAALKAAKTQFQRTGIDKDAAIGDPDHDGPVKNTASPTVAAPAGSSAPSAVATVNATSVLASVSAATAASAYRP